MNDDSRTIRYFTMWLSLFGLQPTTELLLGVFSTVKGYQNKNTIIFFSIDAFQT